MYRLQFTYLLLLMTPIGCIIPLPIPCPYSWIPNPMSATLKASKIWLTPPLSVLRHRHCRPSSQLLSSLGPIRLFLLEISGRLFQSLTGRPWWRLYCFVDLLGADARTWCLWIFSDWGQGKRWDSPEPPTSSVCPLSVGGWESILNNDSWREKHHCIKDASTSPTITRLPWLIVLSWILFDASELSTISESILWNLWRSWAIRRAADSSWIRFSSGITRIKGAVLSSMSCIRPDDCNSNLSWCWSLKRNLA